MAYNEEIAAFETSENDDFFLLNGKLRPKKYEFDPRRLNKEHIYINSVYAKDEYLIEDIPISKILVDGNSYQDLESLHNALSPILFKRGGGNGDGVTLINYDQTITVEEAHSDYEAANPHQH